MKYVWTHDWPHQVDDTNPETDDEGRIMAPDSDDTWDFKRGD